MLTNFIPRIILEILRELLRRSADRQWTLPLWKAVALKARHGGQAAALH
jgi:hypothetical protein